MSKIVLVIRKADKTIHVAELANKSRMQAYSNRLPEGQRWKFEEMEEEEAVKLPMVDINYVTSVEAQFKVQSLLAENNAKDAEIERLKQLLAGQVTDNAGKDETSGGGGGNSLTNEKKENVGIVVDKINASITVEEVNALVKDDDRVTVTKAAAIKIAELTQK